MTDAGGGYAWRVSHAALPRRDNTSGTGESNITELDPLAAAREEITRLRSQLDEQRALAGRYQRLIDDMPGIVYVDEPDATATTTFFSPRIEEILGWTIGPHSPEFWLDTIVYPDDREFVREVIARTNGGERVGVEYRCLTRDGELRWVYDEAAPELDADGVVVQIHGYITDITDRKRAEDERRLADERYRTLLEELPAAVYLDAADEIGTNLFMSRRIEQILGYAAEEWRATPDFFEKVVLHPDDRDRVMEAAATNIGGGCAGSEYRCIHKNGSVVWIHDEATPQFDDEGNVVAVRGFMLDVTDRKLAEEELRRADERLREAQRMESIGRLAGGVAHDFNNLLTVIQGHVDLLLHAEGGSLQAEGGSDALREGLIEVAQAAQRASLLTNQLLAYGRRQVLQPQVLTLNDVLQSLGSMLQRLLGATVALEVSTAPDLWSTCVDRSQIEQVVVNLAVNARDAMPSGGLITITTRNVVVAEADGQTHPPREYVSLTVADTGTGFDEPVKESMFEPFFTTKPVGSGTGLGLATVEGIVRQSGGYVDVESEPGNGATFTVMLPRSTAAVSTLAPEPAPEPRQSPDASILVVEDTPAVRDLIALTLRNAGFTVLTAPDGESALELVAGGDVRVDLLLTDLVMPGMDGRRLAEALRERIPGLPVVFMSGYTIDEIVRHGIATAELAFLAKPFMPGVLVDRVRQMLDGSPPLGSVG